MDWRIRRKREANTNGQAATVKGFVFDIDGTLALTDQGGKSYTPLPGAIETVTRLNEAGVPIAAYTNGTFHTPLEYHQSLAAIGMQFEPNLVITPASVAADYFSRNNIRRLLVLGGEGSKLPLREAGVEVVDSKDDVAGVEAVLVGWYPQFTMPDFDLACRVIWSGAALFTVSNAPFFASRGGRILGISGAIAAMIANVTGRDAILFGKPEVHGLRMACARMGLQVNEVAVVGDDPALEIAMARRGGAWAVGVLTGIGRRETLLTLPENESAHLIIGSIGELLSSDLEIQRDNEHAGTAPAAAINI